MNKSVLEKEYTEVLNNKREAESALKFVLIKKIQNFVRGNNLLRLAELKIKGGAKDISVKFDSYLYN